MHYRVPFCIQRKKFRELWTTNHGDLEVQLYPKKSTFLEDHITVPRECCAPKFLHVLQNVQVLLAYTPKGMGVPEQFFQWGQKLAYNLAYEPLDLWR